MNEQKLISFEVFHPGHVPSVKVNECESDPGAFGRGQVSDTYFAVYRATYSARGNTCNASRYERNDLAGAYALACKPFSETVRRHWAPDRFAERDAVCAAGWAPAGTLLPSPFKTEDDAWKAYAEWSCGAESGRSFEGFMHYVRSGRQ